MATWLDDRAQPHDAASWSRWHDPSFVLWLAALVAVGALLVGVQVWLALFATIV
jgi:hypothetical protein